MKFSINQIVKGKVCGYFVVLGYRTLLGNQFVQVKPFCLETQNVLPGEFALEESCLEQINND